MKYYLIVLLILALFVVGCSKNVSNDQPVVDTKDSMVSDMVVNDAPSVDNTTLVVNESSVVDESPVVNPDDVLESQSQTLADQYISDLDDVADYAGDNYRLVKSSKGDCETCWDFTYEYDFTNGDDVVVKLVTIKVSDNKISAVII